MDLGEGHTYHCHMELQNSLGVRLVVLKFGCTLESSGEVFTTSMPRLYPKSVKSESLGADPGSAV